MANAGGGQGIVAMLALLITTVALWKRDREGIPEIVGDPAVLGFRPFDVERFLKAKGSALAGFRVPGTANMLRPRGRLASDVILAAARHFDVKPEYLLVTLQREQGLIEGPRAKSLTKERLDWATGYGVPDEGPRNERFRGFLRQVMGAAGAVRGGSFTADGEIVPVTAAPRAAGTAVGKWKKLLDGHVVPANYATAVFYSYTPWAVHGETTQKLFRRYGFA